MKISTPKVTDISYFETTLYCIKFSRELIFAIFAILLKSAKISSREIFQNSNEHDGNDGNVFDLF